MVQKVPELREIMLIRMVIGAKTQVALNLLQKEKLYTCPGFFLHFEGCEFTEFKPEPEKITLHPLFMTNFISVKHLTLID